MRRDLLVSGPSAVERPRTFPPFFCMFSMILSERGWNAKAGRKPGTSRRALASSTKISMADWMSVGSFLKVTVLNLQRHSLVFYFTLDYDTELTSL